MRATCKSGSHLMEHWLKIIGTMAHELPERRLYFIVICKYFKIFSKKRRIFEIYVV